MTTKLALKENEIKGIDQSSQTNQVPVNSNQCYRVIVIKPKTYEEGILDNAMKNLGEKIEEPKPTITKTAEKALNPIKPANSIKPENKDLDSMVNDYYSAVNDVNENVVYNKNGATLAGQNDLMAHYTTAGANIFNNFGNNLSSKAKTLYKGIRNIKAKTVEKVGLTFTTLSLIAALTTGCGGVIPEPPPNPPSNQEIVIPEGFDIEYFKEICFSTEYGLKNHPTYRWVDTPKFFLINPSEEQRKIAESKMSELAEFTNYVVVPELVNDINSANITVEWCELDEIPYKVVGYFIFSHKDDVIYKGEILLYKNLDDILTKRAILAEGGNSWCNK